MAAGVYLSEAPNPLLPPCYTLYVYMYPCIYSHREGGGGVDEPKINSIIKHQLRRHLWFCVFIGTYLVHGQKASKKLEKHHTTSFNIKMRAAHPTAVEANHKT